MSTFLSLSSLFQHKAKRPKKSHVSGEASSASGKEVVASSASRHAEGKPQDHKSHKRTKEQGQKHRHSKHKKVKSKERRNKQTPGDKLSEGKVLCKDCYSQALWTLH